MTTSNQYLLLTAMAPQTGGLLSWIAKACHKCKCFIHESNLIHVGPDQGMVFVIKGTWHALAKLETLLPNTKNAEDLKMSFKRVTMQPTKPEGMMYQAVVTAVDHCGILSELCAFFHKKRCTIEFIQTQTYTPSQTSTEMCQVTINLRLPLKTHLATLRDEFLTFCEDKNFDAIFDLLKLP